MTSVSPLRNAVRCVTRNPLRCTRPVRGVIVVVILPPVRSTANDALSPPAVGTTDGSHATRLLVIHALPRVSIGTGQGVPGVTAGRQIDGSQLPAFFGISLPTPR